jgi:hypothetical protein
MIFKRNNEITATELENLFLVSDYAYFVHTKKWIDLILNLRDDNSSIDLSFGVYENSKLVAFIPLVKGFIHNNVKLNELSMHASPLPFPAFTNKLSKNNKDKIEKLIFEKIFKIAKDENISYMSFYVSPLGDAVLNKDVTVNPLSKFGFHDTTVSTNILNLKKKKDVLFRNFRKGTKSDIKTAIKNGLEIKIYDQDNITRKVFDVYKNIHFQAAGRKTRPDKTWDIMFEWIQKGVSILSITTKEGKCISAQLVNTYNKKAYYQSGATKLEHERERGAGHLAQWEIIKYLELNNFTHYELGWNWYPNISQEVSDPKMLGISRFKAGFGADIYPLFRGEWFRDKKYMKKVYDERFEKFVSN